MANIGIIRCEKNEDRCPMTSCIKSLKKTGEGFAKYDSAELIGVFTCKCPGDNVINLGKILKSKGAEAIHFCTCTFSSKKDGAWTLGDGFCNNTDSILEKLSAEVKLPCIKGTAHLPSGYQVEVYE
ncbi:MAG: CGGC domain-containing protein [Dissulfuribacterales bacterium]